MFETWPLPGVKLDWIVNHRSLAGPPICAPFVAYVYQAANSVCATGSMSNTKPCPAVAGSYHAPDRKYEPGGVESPPGRHAMLLPRRESAIEPLRPLPSVNAY